MNGTEKQIKWAEQIRKEYAPIIKDAKKTMQICIEKSTEGTPNNIAFKEVLIKLEQIENEESAVWWIENGKANHEELMKDSQLYKLGNAVTMINPVAKIKAIVAAVK